MEKLIFNPIEGTFDVIDVSVEFYDSLIDFPLTGQVNQLYVAKDTGTIYYWNNVLMQYSTTTGAVPNLQQVTTQGNGTNTTIFITDGTIRTTYKKDGIESFQQGNVVNSRLNINFPIVPTNTTRNQVFQDANGTIALTSDIPSALTPEQIQDSAFSILTDTPTINLNYDDTGNQVTAEVIDNSVDNIKASDMPANSIKSNNTNAVGNPKDIAIPINSSYGRVDELNSGNLTPIPILKLTIQNATLVNGTVTIVDSRITTSTMAIVTAVSGGVLSAVPLTYDVSVAGQITIGNNQIGDNAVITVLMFFN